MTCLGVIVTILIISSNVLAYSRMPKMKAKLVTRSYNHCKLSMQINNKIELEKNPNVFSSLHLLWKFTRPHTIIGSGISLLSVFLFAVPMQLWKTKLFWRKVIEAAIPSLCMNLYITGLNQVTDVEIDKINKPYLPIASGAMPRKVGIFIILCSLFIAAAVGFVNFSQWPLILTLIGSFVLGTIYSLPPFRLKRYPFLAAFCIVSVRGMLVNLGFYFQAKREILGLTSIHSLIEGCKQFPQSLVSSLFFSIFGLVIAFMKDVPDVKGDRTHDIPSLSVQYGPSKIFRLSWKILMGLLLGTSSAIFASFTTVPFTTSSSSLMYSRLIPAIGLIAAAYDVYTRATLIDGKNPKIVFDYYLHIWNIFYICYMLLPFLR